MTLAQAIIAMILQLGPLAFTFVQWVETHLNLTADEKQNIADAIAASNAADEDTKARVAAA